MSPYRTAPGDQRMNVAIAQWKLAVFSLGVFVCGLLLGLSIDEHTSHQTRMAVRAELTTVIREEVAPLIETGPVRRACETLCEMTETNYVTSEERSDASPRGSCVCASPWSVDSYDGAMLHVHHVQLDPTADVD